MPRRVTKRKITEDVEKTTGKATKIPRMKKSTTGTESANNRPLTSDETCLYSLIKDAKWKSALKDEEKLPYFQSLQKQVIADYSDSNKEIFPPKSLIFNALNLTPLDKVRVVVIGQDPYHDKEQAHGLSFSVPHGTQPPPSLKNIYKELQIEGYKTPDHGCLEEWAKRGVLLLNSTLTVEAHKPNSHSQYGWQTFTDAIIRTLNAQTSGVVFILWGGFAQKKEKLIDNKKHGVVKTAHPSPLSATKFLNCNCFKDANDLLKKMELEPVDWSLV